MGCFLLRLDTDRVTNICVVDIGKGWSDAKCWRQVQNHPTHQSSFEYLESNQIKYSTYFQSLNNLQICEEAMHSSIKIYMYEKN